MGLLEGKVAIITGAGGGIGRCYALLFASEGARVVVNDLGGALDGVGSDAAMANQVAGEIQSAGGQAVADFSSVSSAEGVARLFKTALDAFGRVDILVNNAGILRDKTLLKLDQPLWDAVVAVHLTGTYLCGRELALHVKERADGGDPGGVIINTSSYAGLIGNYGQSNYAAAKAGIAGLTRVWAVELRKLGVRVNCIAPMAKTRMTEDIAMVPDDMRPEQVAPMALFLASDLSAEVNGRIFGVHGQQLLEYRQLMTAGATKAGAGLWTPAEIFASLGEISALDHERAPSSPTPAPSGPGAVIDAAFSRLPEVFLAPLARNWTARLVFDIAGADPWTIEVADQVCSTRKGKAADPTCVVTTDAETYAAVIKGELKPDKAFMAGKIKATNLGDVMKFATAFDMKKVRAIVTEALAQAVPAPAPAPAAAPSGPEAVIEAAFSRLPEVFLPARAKGWTARLVFDLAGASPWTIEVADQTCTTRKGRAAEPTCVVTTDVETYAAVLKGELKPDKAFMAGKIKATNLGDVMKFATAFDMKRVKALVKDALARPAATTSPLPAPRGPGAVIDRAFGLLPELFVPARAKGWSAVIQFEIAGATPWTITVADGTCRTEPAKTGVPTCVVTTDAETYAAVVKGELKPDKAFMAGKIKATNLGDMMKFATAFDMKRAQELAKDQPAPRSGASDPPSAATPASPQALVDLAFERLPSVFKPAAAPGWESRLHFDLQGGTGWTLVVSGGKCEARSGLQGEPTCVVTVSLGDYLSILRGELKAETAFLNRRIRASNMSEMLKFGRSFDLVPLQSALGASAPAGGAERSQKPRGLNRELIGKRYTGREPQFVRPEHVALFAEATLDPNPAYTGPDSLTPPLFSVRLLKDVLFSLVGDEALGADLLNLVHGEQDMEFLRPLRAWDLCATRAWVTGIEDKETGQLLRVEEEVWAGGELAVRVKASMFIRDPAKKRAGAAAPKGPSEFPQPAFTREVTIPADAGPRYAEASLDNNPIHTDEEVARLAGFPGVILQGLCSLAMAGAAIVEAAGEGDPGRLRRLKARFSRPVLMGDVLCTQAAQGSAPGSLVFQVVNQRGETVISEGLAELR